MGTTDKDPLLSYFEGDKQKVLSKARVLKVFHNVWGTATFPKLTGHFFRVGGASLPWKLDHPLEEIVTVGQWKSKAYKLYIQEYSDEVFLDKVQLIESRTT